MLSTFLACFIPGAGAFLVTWLNVKRIKDSWMLHFLSACYVSFILSVVAGMWLESQSWYINLVSIYCFIGTVIYLCYVSFLLLLSWDTVTEKKFVK